VKGALRPSNAKRLYMDDFENDTTCTSYIYSADKTTCTDTWTKLSL